MLPFLQTPSALPRKRMRGHGTDDLFQTTRRTSRMCRRQLARCIHVQKDHHTTWVAGPYPAPRARGRMKFPLVPLPPVLLHLGSGIVVPCIRAFPPIASSKFRLHEFISGAESLNALASPVVSYGTQTRHAAEIPASPACSHLSPGLQCPNHQTAAPCFAQSPPRSRLPQPSA